MKLIKAALANAPDKEDHIIYLLADRRTLSKRRWRGEAEDGTEFGFDLEKSLSAGQVVHRDDRKCYVLKQSEEQVIRINSLPDPNEALSLAWQIGNLHFPLQVDAGALYTAEDPAITQMLERAGIAFEKETRVFQPLVAAGHGHGHSHGHHHHHH